ncbi:MAG: hypothetical protein KC422_26265 [Trueperaceae bacterium]|nr:hypothetical protein [Trueperaceae bacterium]
MSKVINLIIRAFEHQTQGDLQETFKQELEQGLGDFLENEGDLQLAIRKAYRTYMDAEAPSNWVDVAERKLKAYCDL